MKMEAPTSKSLAVAEELSFPAKSQSFKITGLQDFTMLKMAENWVCAESSEMQLVEWKKFMKAKNFTKPLFKKFIKASLYLTENWLNRLPILNKRNSFQSFDKNFSKYLKPSQSIVRRSLELLVPEVREKV